MGREVPTVHAHRPQTPWGRRAGYGRRHHVGLAVGIRGESVGSKPELLSGGRPQEREVTPESKPGRTTVPTRATRSSPGHSLARPGARPGSHLWPWGPLGTRRERKGPEPGPCSGRERTAAVSGPQSRWPWEPWTRKASGLGLGAVCPAPARWRKWPERRIHAAFWAEGQGPDTRRRGCRGCRWTSGGGACCESLASPPLPVPGTWPGASARQRTGDQDQGRSTRTGTKCAMVTHPQRVTRYTIGALPECGWHLGLASTQAPRAKVRGSQVTKAPRQPAAASWSRRGFPVDLTPRGRAGPVPCVVPIATSPAITSRPGRSRSPSVLPALRRTAARCDKDRGGLQDVATPAPHPRGTEFCPWPE